jgi:hypothetical protein
MRAELLLSACIGGIQANLSAFAASNENCAHCHGVRVEWLL